MDVWMVMSVVIWGMRLWGNVGEKNTHYSTFFGATVLREVLNISPYTSLGMDIGCGDQKTWNNDNMLSFAQQNFQYSLQTREKSSWKTLGGFATSCFSLGFFSRLSVNICQYRFADLSILSQFPHFIEFPSCSATALSQIDRENIQPHDLVSSTV